MRASVVIATYNRPERLAGLLRGLAAQDLAHDEYEVVVVDDGSEQPVDAIVAQLAGALSITHFRQANAGVAVARQRGVERARGRIVIFLDDDMAVEPDFVRRHLELHEDHPDRVVMGRLKPDARLADMPLFERFYATMLERTAQRCGPGGTFAGHEIYTGNLSLPRELFLRVGGFDPAFFVEDVELGVRLQAEGAEFVFSFDAASVHASDHVSLQRWLARSVVDGSDWVQLAHKHPDALEATPWRHLRDVHPLARPFLWLALLAPKRAPFVARALFACGAAVEKLGFGRAAVSATTVVYATQYFVGVRQAYPTLAAALGDYRTWQRRSDMPPSDRAR